MVVGLLRAARLLSSAFTGVACVVFLRSDIYDMLQFFDKDKLHGEEMRVDWTEERLVQMILTRAQASLGRTIPPEYLWGNLFPASVAGVASQEYIVTHTLMRPRDIIHLCNLCRDTAEQNGHTSIVESDVLYAIVQYSQWKLQDLIIEYRVNYPFLNGLMGIFQDSGYIILRDGLERRFALIHETLRSRYPEHVNTLTPQGVIDVLFDVGFLGVRRSQIVTFGYMQNATIQPTDSEYFIHPCSGQLSARLRQLLRITISRISSSTRCSAPSEATLPDVPAAPTLRSFCFARSNAADTGFWTVSSIAIFRLRRGQKYWRKLGRCLAIQSKSSDSFEVMTGAP
jgi:hypothetical protein